MSKSEKFLVEFVNEKKFFVLKNQSILQASLAAGIPHFHACGGKNTLPPPITNMQH